MVYVQSIFLDHLTYLPTLMLKEYKQLQEIYQTTFHNVINMMIDINRLRLYEI
jgi:hypothetical protein